MAQAKRVRISNGGAEDGYALALQGLELVEKTAIALPRGIGTVSAISACSWDRSGDGKGHATIAVGTVSGCVSLVGSSGSVSTLEDSGGPAVQTLFAKAPAGRGSSGAGTGPLPEVVAGDADGRVTTYVTGRMFSRHMLPAPISALAEDHNPKTPSSFSVGDLGGTVANCHAQEVLWKAQLLGSPAAAGVQAPDPAISSMCSVWLPDSYGVLTGYILAASSSGFVQLLSRGTPVHTIPLSSQCNALCPGVFIDRGGEASKGAPWAAGKQTQAILGDESGRLLVLDDFELVPYARVDYPVTHVFALPLRALAGHDGPDVVVCGTRSNTVYVLHNKKVVATYAAKFWPLAINVAAAFSSAGPAILLVEPEKHASKDGSETLHVVSLACGNVDTL